MPSAAGDVGDERVGAFFEEEFVAHNRKEEGRFFSLLKRRLIEKGEHGTTAEQKTGVDVMEDDHVKAVQLTAVACAFFGLAVLPINYAGLLLILLAIGLFVAEAFITSFGMLTLGGSVCLILGGIMLIDSEVPMLQVSLTVLIPVAVGTGIVAFFLAGKALTSFRLDVQTGTEALIGEIAIADEDFAAGGVPAPQRVGRQLGHVHVTDSFPYVKVKRFLSRAQHLSAAFSTRNHRRGAKTNEAFGAIRR